MAAPEFVPVKPTDEARVYASPPRRPESWRADRPGDHLTAGQPRGDQLGNQGPDQGYVLTLARHYPGELHLTAGEAVDDVTAGAVAVALKRASLFGRAPVVHDLTVAYTVWGFLDDPAAPELVTERTARFASVAHPHHYDQLRAVADAVPDETLRLPHATVAEQHRADWRALLSLGSPAAH